MTTSSKSPFFTLATTLTIAVVLLVFAVLKRGRHNDDIQAERLHLVQSVKCDLSDSLHACSCVPPLDFRDWWSIFRTCGSNSTVELLVKGLSDGSLEIKEEDTDILELLIRPLSFVYPILAPFVPLPRDSSHPQFFDRISLRSTDSGHCYFFASMKIFKCLPSLLIVGFQRAATRELYDWLSVHPDAHGYGSKFVRDRGNQIISVEAHYFDSLPESQRFHGLQPIRRKELLGKLDESWSSIYLEDSPSLNLEEVLRSKFVFEKTPAYADQTDPTTIRELLPSAKMVVALREPEVRLWSAYWRRCAALGRFTCSVADFTSSVVEPAERCGLSQYVFKDEDDFSYKEKHCISFFATGFDLRMILVGHYEVFLKRYENAFRNSNGKMLIMFSESFAVSPFDVMEEVEAHAGLEHFEYRTVARIEPKSQLFFVSGTSKALGAKPFGYLSFDQAPAEMQARTRALYSKATISLKKYFHASSTSTFFSMSKNVPTWFM